MNLKRLAVVAISAKSAVVAISAKSAVVAISSEIGRSGNSAAKKKRYKRVFFCNVFFFDPSFYSFFKNPIFENSGLGGSGRFKKWSRPDRFQKNSFFLQLVLCPNIPENLYKNCWCRGLNPAREIKHDYHPKTLPLCQNVDDDTSSVLSCILPKKRTY